MVTQILPSTPTMQTAQPPLTFLPPAFDPWVWRCAKTILPTWLRYRHDLTRIQMEHGERAVQLYDQFQSRQIRLILAFRHPTTEDPLCLTQVLATQIPQLARHQGVPLLEPVHAHFLYDRGVPLWAGAWAQWGLPKLGATPIQRGKRDRQGLRMVRQLLISGQFPLAVAPEGTVNGHSRILTPLEPGTAQMGFWCVEDLRQAGRSEQVMILPVGVQYHYQLDPWPRLTRLLGRLEQECGLEGDGPNDPGKALDSLQGVQERILQLSHQVISLLEGFYQQFYPSSLSQTSLQLASASTSLSSADLLARLQALLDRALQVAEVNFGLHPRADLVERRHLVEQAGWQRIYRADLPQRQHLSPLERSLADRIAQEAQTHLWHMRWMETFLATTSGVSMGGSASVEGLAEICLKLWQGIACLKGRSTHPQPPRLGSRWARIRFGQPLSVSEREQEYRKNRRGAVTQLTQDLQESMQGLIV